MISTPLLILGLLGLVVLIVLGWRLSSRRHSLPCPSWLGWMVEMDNPFTKANRAQTIIEYLALCKLGHRLFVQFVLARDEYKRQ